MAAVRTPTGSSTGSTVRDDDVAADDEHGAGQPAGEHRRAGRADQAQGHLRRDQRDERDRAGGGDGDRREHDRDASSTAWPVCSRTPEGAGAVVAQPQRRQGRGAGPAASRPTTATTSATGTTCSQPAAVEAAGQPDGRLRSPR